MRRHPLLTATLAAGVAGALVAAGCGDDDSASAGSGGDTPTIAVTISILSDVVAHLTGDLAEVEVVMPPGADPHEFQPSAREAAVLREADVVVANGAGFEAGVEDTIHGAEDDGAVVFEAIDHVNTIDAAEDEHPDPHFFTDPSRMADAAATLAEVLADEVPALDSDTFRERAAGYVTELRALDTEVEATLAPLPAERRKLVTNHDVFAYFAERYGFEVVGAVIPATTTQAAPSAGEIDALAATIEAEGVPAIFAETSSPADLAATLAAEVGAIEIVELYSESLGDEGSGADTYAGMVRTNATRIAQALAP
jgi:zinc/manganese transport system substrate-binding protein